MTKTTPIWKSIHSSLSTDIAEGHYQPGDKLPTEAALSKRFGVNRHTVRRALGQLAEDGIVHARRGAGVFVAMVPAEYPIGRRVRFHRNLQAAGRMPAKEILSLETRACDAREAEALSLDQGDQVHVYDGLSLADAQPIALFRSVFPAERFPGLPQILQQKRSVTAALKHLGIKDYTRSSTQLTAKLASPTQALHLRIPEAAPILRTVGINVDEDGRPIEYGRTWFAGDRVTLTLNEADMS
ncbi:phosphonate metabolism transcriptional regulator PhnF [Roseovarius sp. A21]|uniref:Phosphonate metabolism transcriptional regulator PhnF n=1 Tax=Roseovarius bejariae TaxID=2576383 RepID=A0A844CMV6_9RHOB|nr:phosphonate metabolism transcriptional regulator PhnF [Roseovarius bejariae]MRU15952.1 phosphonate metabolism transcriptional regulator PhnF [Roseovarius bejariae]